MLALAILSSLDAVAANGPPPPSVGEPNGINLGGTSFYDGFAGLPGFSFQQYLKFTSASSIRNNSGKEIKDFDNPKINVTSLINQLSYYSPNTIGAGAHLGWNIIVPIVSLDGDFGNNGPQLKDNATGVGDVTTGPLVQFDPIVDEHGRPVFVQRLALDVLLPVGKYDEHKDLNQGSNFYSINPYWAATWMPAPAGKRAGGCTICKTLKTKTQPVVRCNCSKASRCVIHRQAKRHGLTLLPPMK